MPLKTCYSEGMAYLELTVNGFVVYSFKKNQALQLSAAGTASLLSASEVSGRKLPCTACFPGLPRMLSQLLSSLGSV